MTKRQTDTGIEITFFFSVSLPILYDEFPPNAEIDPIPQLLSEYGSGTNMSFDQFGSLYHKVFLSGSDTEGSPVMPLRLFSASRLRPSRALSRTFSGGLEAIFSDFLRNLL